MIGGSVIQAVGLDLEPTADGWQIDDFAAMLPGETPRRLSGDAAHVRGARASAGTAA